MTRYKQFSRMLPWRVRIALWFKRMHYAWDAAQEGQDKTIVVAYKTHRGTIYAFCEFEVDNNGNPVETESIPRFAPPNGTASQLPTP